MISLRCKYQFLLVLDLDLIFFNIKVIYNLIVNHLIRRGNHFCLRRKTATENDWYILDQKNNPLDYLTTWPDTKP